MQLLHFRTPPSLLPFWFPSPSSGDFLSPLCVSGPRKFHISGNPLSPFTSFFLKGLIFKKRFSLFTFREKRRERERGSETSLIGATGLPLMCPLGTRPTTQAGAPTGNRTSDPSVRRLAPNPLPHQTGILCSFDGVETTMAF